MAHPHDLTISDLMKLLAEKTLQALSTEEFEKLSTDDVRANILSHIYFSLLWAQIESACTLLPDILTALRRAANSRAPVNSLPPEILLRIFAFVPQAPQLTAFDTVQSVCGPLSTRQTWELSTITQVCHRWRSLALNVSSLWSSAFRRPHLGSRRGVIPGNASYLLRCIAGPLQMYVEEDGIILSKWEPLTPIDAPLGYEDRVEELHVVTVDGWKHGILPPSLLSPRLNSLQRLIVRSLHSGTIEASGWQWHGLQSLFHGQPLPLRSLAIIDSPFLPSNPAPALTRLVLFYDMKRDMRETWSHRDLVHFLSATAPTLEEAVICGIPPMYARFHMASAHLDRLQKLSIRTWDYRNSGSPRAPILLLAHIIVPQTCYLRLDAGSVYDLWALAVRVHDHYPEGNLPASNVHCVWASSPYTMSSLQATFPLSGGGGGGGGIRVDFRSLPDLYPDDDDLPGALCALLETPPFAAAETLWVSGSGIDDACEQGLTRSMSTLRGVKALYVANDPLCGDSGAGRFVESLGVLSAPTSSDDPNPPQLPFPTLETLYVTVCDRPAVEKLAEMLHRRADQGCRLSHLLVSLRCAGVGDEDDESESEGAAMLGGLDHFSSALRGAVGDVTVLSEDGYRKEHALRTVLPPLCTRPGGGLIWPPWTENETTFALMHLT